MKRFLMLIVVAAVILTIAACGGSGDGGSPSRPIFVAHVLSDQPADGDIAFDSFRQTFTVAIGPGTLFFGIDDQNPNLPEYRAFLDFPLDGSTGADVVPADAIIVSATLELFIREVSFAAAVAALLDLVTYPVSGLGGQDFNSPPLAFQGLNFFRADQGSYVAVDVTLLMREAQRLALPDFQVRFLLDPALSNIGFVGIEDLPRVTITAPRLTVEYE